VVDSPDGRPTGGRARRKNAVGRIRLGKTEFAAKRESEKKNPAWDTGGVLEVEV